MEALLHTELLSQEDSRGELSDRLLVERTERTPTLLSLTTMLLDLLLKVLHAVVRQAMIILEYQEDQEEWEEWEHQGDPEETPGLLPGNRSPPVVITTTIWAVSYTHLTLPTILLV